MASNVLAAVLVSLVLVSSGRRTGHWENVDVHRNKHEHKEIIFVRHGQSTGNALGASGTTGDFLGAAIGQVYPTNWPMDSVLSDTGMGQVKQRVQQLSDSLRQRLLNTQVMMVSPLRRAMATALLFMAHSYHAELTKRTEDGKTTDVCSGIDDYDLPLPEVKVVIELREKVKSKSDEIGTGKGKYAHSPTYVAEIGKRLEKKLFCKKTVLAPLVLKLSEAFEAESNRTDKWTKHAGDEPKPDNAYLQARNIQYVMQQVGKMPQQHFLLVGHSGWSRFAFAHLMPSGEGDEDPEENLKLGARNIRTLNNCGLICLGMHEGISTFTEEECTLDETKKLPNYDKKGRMTMLALVPDAAAVGSLPADARVKRYWIHRKPGNKGGLLTLSESLLHRKWFLSWSSKWGEPVEGTPITLPASTEVIEDGTVLLIKIGEIELRFDANLDVKRDFEEMLAEVEA